MTPEVVTTAEPGIELEQAACPLCGAVQQERYLHARDYFFHLAGEYWLVRCAACRMLYQSPRPMRASIGRFYPDGYGSYAGAQQGLAARPGIRGALIRRALRRRCLMIDHAVTAAGTRRLLDIGCASGLFLEAMQRWTDWQVEGVELHAPSARAVAERLGITVFAGSFEQARYEAASFEAVTLWDVLEHLHDPLASLREVRRILRPGGVLCVRVPNAASYVAKIGGRYWSGYDLPRHMVAFTPRTLGRMLRAAGFEEVLRTYPSGSYIAAAHSLRFWLDDGRLDAARAARVHRALLHPALRAAAAPLTWCADRIAGGSNIEALVR
jgi:2-polyprenyl-3-methyl-5-hydroxy-6-metoxy-1,4-benzoquinol methylase